MKHILCPVDFSPAANNAVEYAAGLSRKTGAQLTLIRLIRFPDLQDAADIQASAHSDNKRETETMEKLQAYCDLVQEKFSVSCRYIVKNAPVTLAKALKQELKKDPYDLVVMGTNGADNLQQFFFGTNTGNVLGKIGAALLIVPETCSYHHPSHIVYATDYEKEDTKTIKKVVELTGNLHSTVTIIHVSKNTSATRNEVFRCFKDIMEDELEDMPINFHRLIDKDPFTGIDRYMIDKNADLLVLLTKKHIFPGKLFHRSTTRKLSYIATYPVLVFHSAGK